MPFAKIFDTVWFTIFLRDIIFEKHHVDSAVSLTPWRFLYDTAWSKPLVINTNYMGNIAILELKNQVFIIGE